MLAVRAFVLTARKEIGMSEKVIDEEQVLGDDAEFGMDSFFAEKIVIAEVEVWAKGKGLVMDPKSEEILDNIRSRGMKGTTQDAIRLTGASPEKEAENKIIRHDGIISIPSEYIIWAMINAGKAPTYKKFLGISRNDGSWVTSLIMVQEEFLTLLGDQKWKILKKGVPIKTGGSQISIRPLFPEWGCRMTLEFDTGGVPEMLVKDLVRRAGLFHGVGAARKLGYGRVRVTEWKVIEGQSEKGGGQED